MKALIVSALLIASCSPVGSGSGATSTAGSPPLTTASATLSPAPGFTRYTNAELGFSLDLPAGWRRATCSQGVVTRSPLLAAESFLNMPEAEESISPGVRMVIVGVAADRGLTPQAWLETNARQPDARIEPATLGGRTGARAFIAPTGGTYAFALAARGSIYQIERPFFGSPDQELERILATLRILDDATVGRGPVPTPTPRTIESVVDSIADGFAKKDLAAIAETMPPCVTSGGIPGDAAMLSRANFLKTLAAEFAGGMTVQVRPRPIESDPNFGRLVRASWSKPGAAQQAVDLALRADGDRWSVVGFFFRAPGY